MLVLLDVVIGVAFVYLLLALICTTANEWIAGARGLRAKTLQRGIGQLLGPLADEFYRHPLIATLSQPGERPSYIPAHIFSSAVLDLLGRHAEGRVLCPKERGQVGAPREERGTTLLEPAAAGSGAALVVDRVELQHDAQAVSGSVAIGSSSHGSAPHSRTGPPPGCRARWHATGASATPSRDTRPRSQRQPGAHASGSRDPEARRPPG